MEPKGKNGFGYDPIFIPAGKNKLLVKFLLKKYKIDHRFKALKKLKNFFKRTIFNLIKI